MISGDASEVFALGARFQRSTPRLGALVAAALRKTAFDIEADAKALAPVDTGNLRSSISTTLEGDGRGAAMAAEIGPTAEYGAFVEYGTSRSGPQPFMRPAFERRTPAFEAVISALDGELF